jgi:hypothetical protein
VPDTACSEYGCGTTISKKKSLIDGILSSNERLYFMDFVSALLKVTQNLKQLKVRKESVFPALN